MKNKNSFNGNRLREARRYRGKTIAELAKKLNITKQMVSKYENNKSIPPLEASFILMRELGFPREFFYSSDLFDYKDEGTYFRSNLTAIQKDKEPATYDKKYIAVIRDFLGQYIDFPDNKTKSIDDENVETVASNLRDQWGLSEKPIPNMMRLMEEQGFVISIIESDCDKIDAAGGLAEVNNNSYNIIMIEGESYSFYRQQFSLAHELGHWALDYGTENPQELDSESYKIIEKNSNNFASVFLLPKVAFINSTNNLDLTSIESYLILKKLWYVSIGTLVMRAKALKLINSDDYIKLQKQINYRRWRKKEPYDDTKITMRPVALKQSIELLVDNNIIECHEIVGKIYQQYGIFFSAEMIEQICGLKKGYLQNQNSSKINLKVLQ